MASEGYKYMLIRLWPIAEEEVATLSKLSEDVNEEVFHAMDFFIISFFQNEGNV